MQLEELKARMYYLAGQMAEAKRTYEKALGEVNASSTKQDVQQTDSANTGNAATIPS